MNNLLRKGIDVKLLYPLIAAVLLVLAGIACDYQPPDTDTIIGTPGTNIFGQYECQTGDVTKRNGQWVCVQ